MWLSSSLLQDLWLLLSWQSLLDFRTSEQHSSGCGKRGWVLTGRQGCVRDHQLLLQANFPCSKCGRDQLGSSSRSLSEQAGSKQWNHSIYCKHCKSFMSFWINARKEEEALVFVRKENTVMLPRRLASKLAVILDRSKRCFSYELEWEQASWKLSGWGPAHCEHGILLLIQGTVRSTDNRSLWCWELRSSPGGSCSMGLCLQKDMQSNKANCMSQAIRWEQWNCSWSQWLNKQKIFQARRNKSM